MMVRELPRAEWGKIVEADAGRDVLAAADPEHVRVVVVESDDGRVVGSWVLMRVVHVECLWVAPEHRKMGSVLRRLLQGMAALARRAFAARTVVTHATAPEIEDLIASYGGSALPGRAWLLPLRGGE